MNIGIRLHDTAPGTLKERLAYAKAQGFSCAHVAISKIRDDFDMKDAPEKLNAEYAEQFRRDFEEAGMECAVLGCYLNLADPDPERRARTQEIYKAHLRFAAMTGAQVVGTETYANPESVFAEPAPQSEEAFRLFMDSLRPVVRFAEESGAVLAVEPVWYHIISTPERAARMLEEVSSDHLHMKDFILQPDGKMDACACGLGSMQYGRLLSFAAEKNLPMTMENTVPENAEEARLFLERTAGKL